MTNNNPIEYLTNMVNQYNLFKKNYHGNAEQEVQDLLRSGKMTQQQFNQIQQTAYQFQQFQNFFR